jgi:hypothetical protein
MAAIDPAMGGNPALSVRAVREGILIHPDMTPDRASDLLYYALSEDAEGITEYLLKELESGNLDILQSKLPFPPDVLHPALPKLMAGYTKAFSAAWEKSGKNLPFALRQLQHLPPRAFQDCLSAMAQAGPDSMRLAATLYPKQIASRPQWIGSSLDLLEKPEARLALLNAALATPENPPELLTRHCRFPLERVLLDLYHQSAPVAPSPQTGLNAEELLTLLQVIPPSEKLYAQAISLQDPSVSDRMKTEIIRNLSESNLVAATRALAQDPTPPDEAIATAVSAMSDDPEAARAWAARIRDPEIRARVVSSMEAQPSANP